MSDPLFPLLLVMRYLHILGAIALMGGTIFMRFGLAPAAAALEPGVKATLHEQVRSRWSKLVMAAAGMLLVSGITNMILYSSRRYDIEPVFGMSYAMVVGIKFLLALPIFFFASLLAGRSESAKKFQANAVTWMNLNLVLALLMVLIGGVLKFVQRSPKEAPPPAAAVAAPGEKRIAAAALSLPPARE